MIDDIVRAINFNRFCAIGSYSEIVVLEIMVHCLQFRKWVPLLRRVAEWLTAGADPPDPDPDPEPQPSTSRAQTEMSPFGPAADTQVYFSYLRY